MDENFERAWKEADGQGVPEALERDEGELLWQTAVRLPRRARIVEIGCECGRSSVLFAHAAKLRDLRLTHVDPWNDEPVAIRNAASWMMAMRRVNHPFTLHCMRTDQLQERAMLGGFDLVYVDGDHSREGVGVDCDVLLPRAQKYVAFHDYGRQKYPATPEIDKRMRTPAYRFVAQAGTMIVWERA